MNNLKPSKQELSTVIQEKCPHTGNILNHYTKGRQLGKGGFSVCHEVINLKTNRKSAVKIIDKTTLTQSKAKQKLSSQIKIHSQIKSPYVVKFEHSFEDSQFVYIILELCDNKNLYELIKRRKKLTEIEVKYYMHQLIVATKDIHEQNVIHRDLKLGNLLLTDKLEIRIGDFGLAAKVASKSQRRKTKCGTPNYIAPQILDNKGYSFEVDIWSLGVIAYALAVGTPPFETSGDLKTTYTKIQNCKYSYPEDANVSDECKSFISKMLQLDPSKRATVSQLLQDEFFTIAPFPLSLPWYTLTQPPNSNFMKQYTLKPIFKKQSQVPSDRTIIRVNSADKIQNVQVKRAASTTGLMKNQPTLPKVQTRLNQINKYGPFVQVQQQGKKQNKLHSTGELMMLKRQSSPLSSQSQLPMMMMRCASIQKIDKVDKPKSTSMMKGSALTNRLASSFQEEQSKFFEQDSFFTAFARDLREDQRLFFENLVIKPEQIDYFDLSPCLLDDRYAGKQLDYYNYLYYKSQYPQNIRMLPSDCNQKRSFRRKATKYFLKQCSLCGKKHLAFVSGQKFVPMIQRKKYLIQKVHFGHISTDKMLAIIHGLRYKWRNQRKQIVQYVKKCQVCQEKKANHKIGNRSTKLRCFITAPRQMVQIDYVLLNEQISDLLGYKYLLNVTQLFSKYSMSDFVNEKSSLDVIKIVERMLAIFTPLKIKTDNSKQFCSHEFTSYLQRQGISLLHGPPYQPQAKGLVQRFNQTCQKFLRCVLIQNRAISQNQMLEMYDLFLRNYNKKWPHSLTEYPPSQILFLDPENKVQDLLIVDKLRSKVIKRIQKADRSIFEIGCIALMMCNFTKKGKQLLPAYKKKINSKLNSFEIPVEVVGFKMGLLIVQILVDVIDDDRIKKKQQYLVSQRMLIKFKFNHSAEQANDYFQKYRKDFNLEDQNDSYDELQSLSDKQKYQFQVNSMVARCSSQFDQLAIAFRQVDKNQAKKRFQKLRSQLYGVYGYKKDDYN